MADHFEYLSMHGGNPVEDGASRQPRSLKSLAGGTMSASIFRWRRNWIGGAACTLLSVSLFFVAVTTHASRASPPCPDGCGPTPNCQHGCPPYVMGDGTPPSELGGAWYWLRSPEEEKRVVTGLFNRYCIRCHGVDGRGVWDMPGIPDFTHVAWQASRTDPQLVRIILEGRGAVMPPFRGALSLEEAWAMARYLRTFVPGTEASRPDTSKSSSQPSTSTDKSQREAVNLLLPTPTRIGPSTVSAPE
jgi:hypothetical protein